MEAASRRALLERARSYQIELFECAKQRNTIVCLGTGTGKTYISVLLLKHLEYEIAGPWEDGRPATPGSGGKRSIFLAPTVPLVEQQGAVLEQHLSVKVGVYVGAMQVRVKPSLRVHSSSESIPMCSTSIAAIRGRVSRYYHGIVFRLICGRASDG